MAGRGRGSEARQEQTIGQIFANVGEAGFRAMEGALLQEFCRLRRQIIATGAALL